jgi:hypothetical protein
VVIQCIACKSVNYGARGRQGGRGSVKIIICRYSNPCVSCTIIGEITAHGVAMHSTLSIILVFSIYSLCQIDSVIFLLLDFVFDHSFYSKFSCKQ